jgi:hypothetical protein
MQGKNETETDHLIIPYGGRINCVKCRSSTITHMFLILKTVSVSGGRLIPRGAAFPKWQGRQEPKKWRGA